MSLFEYLGKFTIRLLNSKHLFPRRLPFALNPSVNYAGIRVSADDLRGLPEKPKKPLSPYFRFMAEMRPEYKKENPDCKVTDIVKLIADKWEKTSMESKQKYMEDYKKDLVAYSNARLRYEEQLTDEQKELMKKAKEETEIAKENRKLKKAVHASVHSSCSWPLQKVLLPVAASFRK
ncbi:high mobility group protein C-like isoform X2 [Hetaerina americana]|uniref:high mobility group protein C-like isoform X2 n=1 Tax=Hetaerina americana TaxID=62018 RepID=UPI003A7F2299